MSAPAGLPPAELVALLSDPAALGEAGPVEVRQTHISIVFLAGGSAYKVKKGLDLGFLDYTTLEARRRCCEEEVRLNRRLAPRVYRGVVPIVRDGARLRVGGAGPVVEWAVHMARLDPAATLEARLAAGELDPDLLEGVARRIARFHAGAERSPAIAAAAGAAGIAANCRENFAQTEGDAGTTVDPGVFERVRRRTAEELDRLRPAIDARVRAGRPCDTHGDLRLEHVYLYPDAPPPDDVVVVDCIEFNPRFRWADPVSDVAFLTMDLGFRGRRDLAGWLAAAYLREADDPGGAGRLRFDQAYRAVVRAKVNAITARTPELAPAERERRAERARGHWLYALGELEPPARRPCLVLVGGLPGTGKSTLARALAARLGLEVVASDVVRKELAGVAPEESRRAAWGEGIYTSAWTDRTYRAIGERVRGRLLAGGRVLVDASLREEARRRALAELAEGLGVPAVMLLCEAPPELVRRRLRERRGDVSDAGARVYERAAAELEPPAPATLRMLERIPARDAGEAAAAALAALVRRGLAEP